MDFMQNDYEETQKKSKKKKLKKTKKKASPKVFGNDMFDTFNF